jgi:hypothetical protein
MLEEEKMISMNEIDTTQTQAAVKYTRINLSK